MRCKVDQRVPRTMRSSLTPLRDGHACNETFATMLQANILEEKGDPPPELRRGGLSDLLRDARVPRRKEEGPSTALACYAVHRSWHVRKLTHQRF